MSLPTPLRRPLIAVASFIVLGCATHVSGRYALERGSRSPYGSAYVRDRATRHWIYREFELRVDSQRLSDVLSDTALRDVLSVQLFRAGSARAERLRGGGVVAESTSRYVVWRGIDVVDASDLAGRVSYGVSLTRRPESVARAEPMELFPLPRLDDAAPGEWSAWMWMGAAAVHDFGSGSGSQAPDKPNEQPPRIEHPFELRWRIVLSNTPGAVP